MSKTPPRCEHADFNLEIPPTGDSTQKLVSSVNRINAIMALLEKLQSSKALEGK